MALEDIYWHDSIILDVSIDSEKNQVVMRVLYPEDWVKENYAERHVVFDNAYDYKEFEGPFDGKPTILSASVTEQHDKWQVVRLETNAGYREVSCFDVYLKSL